MPYLGDTLLFLDTGFFKDYKSRNEVYKKLFGSAAEGSIVLCTSDLCLEEWRTQKVKDLKNNVRDFKTRIGSHCGENYFSFKLIPTELFDELENPEIIRVRSLETVDAFLNENRIKRYPPKESHIDPTWNSYFHGTPPFKCEKNHADIPDAWIFEAAKDALNQPEHLGLTNRLCISGDTTMRSALMDLGFSSITLRDLIDALNKDTQAGPATEDAEQIADNQTQQNKTLEIGLVPSLTIEKSSLDKLLVTAPNEKVREIYLRLLGYIIPLDTPTHDTLREAIVANGFESRLVDACAVILSDKSRPYIRDTGTHYIVGDKEICLAASDRLTHEIIDMLDRQ